MLSAQGVSSAVQNLLTVNDALLKAHQDLHRVIMSQVLSLVGDLSDPNFLSLGRDG